MISEHDRQVLSRLPVWNPAGDMVAQRRAWEELAVVYNQDLPAIGALEENVELRAGLRADIAVPKLTGPHPVAIYLHGGGWAFGSPASFRKLGMQFAEAGYLTGGVRGAVRRPMGARQRAAMERATGRASRSAAIPPAATCR